MRGAVMLGALVLASWSIPWPSYDYLSGGAYQRAAQVYTALVERAYACEGTMPNPPRRMSADWRNLVDAKGAMRSLLATNVWVHPESAASCSGLLNNALGYLSPEVALAMAIPGGLPTNWWDVTPVSGLATATNGWRYVTNIIAQMRWTVASGYYVSSVVERAQTIVREPFCTNIESVIWKSDKLMREDYGGLWDAKYNWRVVATYAVVPPYSAEASVLIVSGSTWETDPEGEDGDVCATVETTARLVMLNGIHGAHAYQTNLQARPYIVCGRYLTTKIETNCGAVVDWVLSTNVVQLAAADCEYLIASNTVVIYHPAGYDGYTNEPLSLATFDEACTTLGSESWDRYSQIPVVPSRGKVTAPAPASMLLDWASGPVPFEYR